jgi:hypothetical protein
MSFPYVYLSELTFRILHFLLSMALISQQAAP